MIGRPGIPRLCARRLPASHHECHDGCWPELHRYAPPHNGDTNNHHRWSSRGLDAPPASNRGLPGLRPAVDARCVWPACAPRIPCELQIAMAQEVDTSFPFSFSPSEIFSQNDRKALSDESRATSFAHAVSYAACTRPKSAGLKALRSGRHCFLSGGKKNSSSFNATQPPWPWATAWSGGHEEWRLTSDPTMACLLPLWCSDRF